MLKYYIANYIKNMSINDVINYSNKIDYEITNNEAEIILNSIKNDWETIIFDDHKIILDKMNINKNLYDKLNTLIIEYKNKYYELIKKY